MDIIKIIFNGVAQLGSLRRCGELLGAVSQGKESYGKTYIKM